ncbi:Serine/threonine-protein phosphatase 4 regulatory subunit 1 [Mortierella alpina]|nr:Serine/threonine-protein phosphatase 4 regulatory subunit 1 [Mortierella alpina]
MSKEEIQPGGKGVLEELQPPGITRNVNLGLYFGEDEDDAQMEQEDKDLSYLELSNEQDDAFDSVDTETLLAEMAAGPSVSSDDDLDADADIVHLFASADISALEKARILSKSVYEFHREVATILPEMNTHDAISCVIPIVRDFSSDSMEPVRESLASQLDKIVLYFYQNAMIVDEEPAMEQEAQDVNGAHSSPHPPSIPHGVFTPIFINLLLDQNAGIAHQARNAVVSVAESVPDQILESEILNGVVAGLEKLYSSEAPSATEKQDTDMQDDSGDQGDNGDQDDSGDQDGEAELGKMLVVVLLTSLANVLGKKRCIDYVLPTLERLAKKSQFYVRKEIVMALGTLCKIVDQETVIDRLLPLYDAFVQDDTWHIRRACCTVLASFVSSLPVEMKTAKVEQIYDLFSVDVSRSVRNSIMEVLGEVIAGFEKEKVPDSLLKHFLNMGQQPLNEHELAVMCAFSFPAVILTAGRSKWEEMKPVYMRLAGTFRSPIRRSLACSLHEVARILGPELADRDLALAFSDCLLAEDEVKEGVIGHVVDFVSCLSPKCRSEALRDIYNAWTELERSSNWRLRDSLAGQLPALCEIAEADDLLQYLMPLSVRACTDGVSTIRESGVMAFPALWEASARIGPFTPTRAAERPVSTDASEGGVILGSFGDGEDVEMEDVTTQLKEPSKDCTQSSTAGGSTAESPSSVASKSDEPAMTTMKDEVIRQTVEFTTTGGFRSRVVAVQIIQSLLDHGITVEEFEEHFLSLLIDQLATDAVVNVRIWVSRVASWIIESGYYYDVPVSTRLQDLLIRLQQDPDRDVRIYAGGPAELPKPKKKKKKSKKKKDQKKKKEQSPFRQGTTERSQVSTINEEDEDAEEVQFLQGEGDSDSNDDEDEDDDSDGDDDDDSDDGSSDDSMDFLNSAKSKGISNKPRNRNSLGIGMKVMVGNKLTVSGKEIRKPKTSWDYVHGEIEDDEEEGQDGSGNGGPKTFSAALGACKEKQGQITNHWNQDGDGDLGGSDEEGGSLFDAPRKPLEHDDYDDDDDDDEASRSGDISKVIPYTAQTANGASPLVVEMDEAVQDSSGERVAVVVSSNDTSSVNAAGALAGQESRATSKPSKGESESSSAPTTAKNITPPTTAKSGARASPIQSTLASTLNENGPLKSPVKSRVTVDAANTGTTGRNGNVTSKGRSPEEEVLRVLNAKIGAGKKLHPALPPLSIAPPSKKAMMNFKDPGSPSYAAIVASGANSPHPANSPRPSPPLLPMVASPSKPNSQ